PSNLSAIVTVADDGGSSGRLRDEYRILPPGDFRQCLIALADAEPLMKQLFDHRFSEGSLNGHAFGNLFIMAMADVTGNFEQALRESGKVLAVKGTIVPSTLQDVTLVASINGGTVEGESKIPKQNSPISHVFLKPDGVQVNPEAAQAIINAELIIVGPGSLYTSILPNLLVEGMVEAIKASAALKLYICNLAAQPGETDGYGVQDYLRVIREHVGANLFDFVLVKVDDRQQHRHRPQHQHDPEHPIPAPCVHRREGRESGMQRREGGEPVRVEALVDVGDVVLPIPKRAHRLVVDLDHLLGQLVP